MIGQTLAHFRITGKLGAGGMGEVYRAEDTKLGRDVAVKVLPVSVAKDPDRLARFAREAQAVAALNHPNIVTIYSVEEAEGTPFLAMELVTGRRLDEAVPQRGMPLPQFAKLALQIVEGVATAHRAEVVHRDLKPSNIMLTAEDRIKILDFGLAKLRDPDQRRSLDSEGPTAIQTEEGQVLGTPAYMAPEQAEGLAVDARADVFALGAVLYQMLTGERPFSGMTRASQQAALLTADPKPIRKLRQEVPRELERIVQRCLEKDPAARFGSAVELLSALGEVAGKLGLSEAGGGVRIRLRLAIAAILLFALVAGGAVWLVLRFVRSDRARKDMLPRIERHLDEGQFYESFLMAKETEPLLPEDPVMKELIARCSDSIRVTTEPSGADVYYKNYRDVETPWQFLGRTPLDNVQVPAEFTLRWKVEKEGFETLEMGQSPRQPILNFTLTPDGDSPPGMLYVPAGTYPFGGGAPVEVEAFWLDRFEVSNRQYKEFVDAGGYGNPQYWMEAFRAQDASLSWEEAMSQFVDSTGRPGPAGWALGAYPEGRGDDPVGGVSWFEAAAYAAFVGKSLPTVYHWRQAAPWTPFGDMLLLSNFNSEGPQPVGSLQGIGQYGHLDMAGNVFEWCWNRAGDNRYHLGGSWEEPSYVFSSNIARSPFERQPDMGFRCAKYLTPPSSELMKPVSVKRHDFEDNEPIPDETFAFYRSLYDYEPTALEPRIESVDDSMRHWRRETVSVTAAYGDERVLIHLFLPHDIPPPYQPVVYVPGSSAAMQVSIEDMGSDPAFFVPRSGRALVWPAYKGTLERGGGVMRPRSDRALRDLIIQKVNDLQRTIDYLERRDDIDSNKLAYLGLSAGSEYGPIYTAIEQRFQVLAFIAGGFDDMHMLDEPDEVNPWHYATRVTTPTLMINGRSDYGLPVDTAQKPMFDLLAVSAKDKRHAVLEGGHYPYDQNAIIREILSWYDQYLGPVSK
jgi:formylglycine-generating enzyme required for sulfatase activity